MNVQAIIAEAETYEVCSVFERAVYKQRDCNWRELFNDSFVNCRDYLKGLIHSKLDCAV
jgi:hypothetical protein